VGTESLLFISGDPVKTVAGISLQINSEVLLGLAGGGCVLSRIFLVGAYTSRRDSTILRGANGSGVPCVLVVPVMLRHTGGLREDAWGRAVRIPLATENLKYCRVLILHKDIFLYQEKELAKNVK
jgi:hypothetical protein